MRKFRLTILLLAIGLSPNLVGTVWAIEDYQKDSPEGLPPEYAKNYLVLKSSMSPDEKFAVIYPTQEFAKSKDARNLFVALKPFNVLATLPAAEPYFDNKSSGAPGADWSSDGSKALITYDGEGDRAWDVFLVELADDKVKRVTNLLDKVRDLLRPKFRAAKPKPKAYNAAHEFAFEVEEGGPCQFTENERVRIYVKATNDPKGRLKQPWRVLVDAEWDIAQAKFTSQKVTPKTPTIMPADLCRRSGPSGRRTDRAPAASCRRSE
jgi:hypothetical protein